jgi:hypothetical protein
MFAEPAAAQARVMLAHQDGPGQVDIRRWPGPGKQELLFEKKQQKTFANPGQGR